MRAIITGTFDPITVGHESLIKRASHTFDEVTVLMCQNFDKKTLFTPDARLELIKLVASTFPNVNAESHEGWLYEYLRKTENSVLFKGVRDSRDLEYEKKMAEFNFEHSGVETLFVFSSGEYSTVSSTLVRSLMTEGGDWLKFIPQIAQKKAEYFYKNL